MSAGVTVIADELTAAMFRLAGARVLSPDARAVTEVFASVRDDSTLVLITAELAAHLPAPVMDEARKATRPLTLVIADARNRKTPPDVARQTRRVLGVDT